MQCTNISVVISQALFVCSACKMERVRAASLSGGKVVPFSDKESVTSRVVPVSGQLCQHLEIRNPLTAGC